MNLLYNSSYKFYVRSEKCDYFNMIKFDYFNKVVF